MAIAIDAARRDDAALGVDLPAAGAELGADYRDTAVDDADVGTGGRTQSPVCQSVRPDRIRP